MPTFLADIYNGQLAVRIEGEQAGQAAARFIGLFEELTIRVDRERQGESAQLLGHDGSVSWVGIERVRLLKAFLVLNALRGTASPIQPPLRMKDIEAFAEGLIQHLFQVASSLEEVEAAIKELRTIGSFFNAYESEAASIGAYARDYNRAELLKDPLNPPGYIDPWLSRLGNAVHDALWRLGLYDFSGIACGCPECDQGVQPGHEASCQQPDEWTLVEERAGIIRRALKDGHWQWEPVDPNKSA